MRVNELEDQLKQEPIYKANKGFAVVNGNDIALIKNSPDSGKKFRPYQRKGDHQWSELKIQTHRSNVSIPSVKAVSPIRKSPRKSPSKSPPLIRLTQK